MRSTQTFVEPEGLRVTVDRVEYRPDAVTPPERPHCFVYFISIHNDTGTPVTIKGRKWVVTSDTGEVVAVEGDGVVGQHPEIGPGKRFSYNSYHLTNTRRASATGSYLGLDAEGRRVVTRIPRFEMVVPG